MNFRILETVLNLIQGYFLSKCLKHTDHIIRGKISFSNLEIKLTFPYQDGKTKTANHPQHFVI